MLTNKEFLILSKSKLLLTKVNDLLENVPRKDMFYKDRLRYYILDLIDNINHINNLYYNKEIKYFNNIMSNLMMIDFMLERLLYKKYISDKSLIKVTNILIEIKKMCNKWGNNLINE